MEAPSSGKHSSNYAVIVSASRYWFNYRHVVNALSIYQVVKDNGIPDENIVLMLGDEIPTNARNPYKNGMFSNGIKSRSLYDADIEIDYRGEDVTVENLVKVLSGRGSQRQLLLRDTDENSHILIYLTGHGGDEFFKFQDVEEIMAEELARVFDDMHRRKRYKEILFVADTCQAFTLANHFQAPNIHVVASSLKDESSYAHHSDIHLGLSVIEHYTHAFVQFLQKHSVYDVSLKQAMVDPYSFRQQRAHVGYREDLSDRKFHQIPLSDFFANVGRSPSGLKIRKDKVIITMPDRTIRPPSTSLELLSTRINSTRSTIPPQRHHPPNSLFDPSTWIDTDDWTFLFPIAIILAIFAVAASRRFKKQKRS